MTPKAKKTKAVKKTQGKKRNKLKIFLLAILTIFIVASVGIYIYGNRLLKDTRDKTVGKVLNTDLKSGDIISDLFGSVPKRVNFLILGVDAENTRTDVMMLGCYNTETKNIDIISIPRDTYVEFTPEQEEILLKNERKLPGKGYLTLNTVHEYAGPKMGVDFIVNELQDMFNVKIEYYVKINLEGFRYIVDKIGGVEFDVPQRMIYHDPTQDLNIDLYPGMQVLNGSEAEGLIRYRQSDEGMEELSPSYKMADIERIAVQQEFIKAFIIQTLSDEKIIGNIGALLSTIDKYVNTNFNINEVPKYLSHLKNISSDNINTYTVPFDLIELPNEKYAWVKIDQSKANKLIESIFYDEEDIIEKSSKGRNIQILNGGYITGMAKNTEDMLTEKGFDISNIGDYEGTKNKETYILVHENGLGRDLLDYFEYAIIREDDKSYPDYDITIIVGSGQEDYEVYED